MKQYFVFCLSFLFLFTSVSYGFDGETASKFNSVFSQLTPEMIAKKPCEINAKQLFEMIRANEDFVILDIRTPQEMQIVGITYKNTLKIPMHELFKEENLQKLPTDKKIVVVCHTGTRASATVMALRAVGFNNAYMFKGGIIELAAEAGRSVVGILW
ncbi:MAG TPA: rhodanese-like domain-containing protein [Thermodesulfovibrio thiophilus]|uniref:rhodanese-like domain-containing protein n=1 Tax=Thermodesulfovibrio thiophilus TaxID=340095 RepID=UPI000405E551|nr:rhodanese-like domain-containing protein [Thermodesulfovibrio thiophilus]HOA83410.1 rhodanese-like domain-containing protein [Thermodesulfovibrio thiophilus]HQD36442.1 rhodanese-like domain-containing protein [Thermodesulfovibrio thiophilus]